MRDYPEDIQANDRKTKGWLPGKILAGEASEDPARARPRQELAPGKIPLTLPPRQRSDRLVF